MSTESRIKSALDRIERHQRVRRALTILAVFVVLAVTVWGLTHIGFTIAELWRQRNAFIDSLYGFTHPAFGDLPRIAQASIVTIVVGFTGTVIGFPLALLFGVLGSERVTPFPFNFLFRGTMSTIRAVPALVWILIYVPLAGITPVSAVLAVATDTVGNLGRLFTDELEEIDEGPIEAIRSTGASEPQTVVFGMLSQVFTSFIAWTLYILEINVRVAISLGVVGAGGIGRYIQSNIGLLQFQEAAAGIIMVIAIVLSVELVSSRLRSRLRPSESEEGGRGIVDALKSLFDADKWAGSGGGGSK